MKIISKFKDYYDAGLVYGIDNKLVFVRESHSFQNECDSSNTEYLDVQNMYEVGEKRYFQILGGVIGFCGKFYTHFMLRFFKKVPIGNNATGFEIIDSDVAYDIKAIKDFLEKHNIKYINEDYNYKNKGLFNLRKIEKIFNENLPYDYQISKYRTLYEPKQYNDYKRYESIFKEKEVPYFYIGQYSSINKKIGSLEYFEREMLIPLLKNHKFAKIIDAYKAFQEISMFLGALNLNENKIVEIDDKYLAEAKGFNKCSFRKKSEKKTRGNKC